MNDSIRSVSAAILVVLTYRRWKLAMSLIIFVRSGLIASDVALLVRYSKRSRAKRWPKTEMSVYDSFVTSIGMSCLHRVASTARPLFSVNT